MDCQIRPTIHLPDYDFEMWVDDFDMKKLSLRSCSINDQECNVTTYLQYLTLCYRECFKTECLDYLMDEFVLPRRRRTPSAAFDTAISSIYKEQCEWAKSNGVDDIDDDILRAKYDANHKGICMVIKREAAMYMAEAVTDQSWCLQAILKGEGIVGGRSRLLFEKMIDASAKQMMTEICSVQDGSREYRFLYEVCCRACTMDCSELIKLITEIGQLTSIKCKMVMTMGENMYDICWQTDYSSSSYSPGTKGSAFLSIPPSRSTDTVTVI